jgi:hypothetical protein
MGAAPFSPVSTGVKTNIKKEKIFLIGNLGREVRDYLKKTDN